MYLRMGVWDCVAFDAGEYVAIPDDAVRCCSLFTYTTTWSTNLPVVCRYVQVAAALGHNLTLREEESAKIVAKMRHIFVDQTAIRAFDEDMITAFQRARE